MNIYRDWLDGKIGHEEALEALCRSLSSVLEHKSGWETEEKALRAVIAEVVEKGFEGRTELIWFGKVEMTRPRVVDSYDTGKVDAVLARLVAEGHPLAQELALARKQTTYSGSLRITRVKGEE